MGHGLVWGGHGVMSPTKAMSPESLITGENIYIRGFGSFITKKRAAKIGRNIKKNVAVHIPEHFIPAFKPAKEFVADVKKTSAVE